eukprot:5493338-Pleurochrysis_carterae.AAC.2
MAQGICSDQNCASHTCPGGKSAKSWPAPLAPTMRAILARGEDASSHESASAFSPSLELMWAYKHPRACLTWRHEAWIHTNACAHVQSQTDVSGCKLVLASASESSLERIMRRARVRCVGALQAARRALALEHPHQDGDGRDGRLRHAREVGRRRDVGHLRRHRLDGDQKRVGAKQVDEREARRRYVNRRNVSNELLDTPPFAGVW